MLTDNRFFLNYSRTKFVSFNILESHLSKTIHVIVGRQKIKTLFQTAHISMTIKCR